MAIHFWWPRSDPDYRRTPPPIKQMAIHWSLPSQLKIGHECVFTQKQDLVQLFSCQSSTMVSGCEASNGEKALHIGRTWWRSKVSADYLQKSFPHWVWLPRFFLVFFPKPANYTKLGSLIHNCKPQAFVLFKGKPKVVFNGWGYGSCSTLRWKL